MFRNPCCADRCCQCTRYRLPVSRREHTSAVSPISSYQTAQDPRTVEGGSGNQATPPAPRPYAQVITAAAKTDEGIVKVHRVGETLYYEIPKAQLGKDFLWNTQIKKTTIGAGYGGQAAGSRTVRWVAKGDRVLLLSIDYSLVADQSNPVFQAVDDANYPTIIRAFNVAAYSPSGDPVIDVTPLFLTDVPEISVRGRIGGRGFDPPVRSLSGRCRSPRTSTSR